MRCLSNQEPGTRSRALAIFEGQAISLCVFGTGAFSTVLAVDNQFDAPAFQSMFNYVCLSLYIFVAQPWKNGLTHPWWFYLIFALIDVNANYLAVLAYQYTNITSAQLLNCFTIPCVMVLSVLFLKARYQWIHLAAVLLCLAGMGLTVYLDVTRNPDNVSSASDVLKGDLMVLGGATMYAIGNVFQEFMVKRLAAETLAISEEDKPQRCVDPFIAASEFLGMIGIFGVLVSALHVVTHERDNVAAIEWSDPTVYLYIGGYVLCLTTMYNLAAHFLAMFDAAVMNLSLLTTHIFAAVFDFFRGGSFRVTHSFYAVSFALTIGGLIWYHTMPPPTRAVTEPPATEPSEHDE